MIMAQADTDSSTKRQNLTNKINKMIAANKNPQQYPNGFLTTMEFKSAVMDVWRNRQNKPLFSEQNIIVLMSRYQD